MLAPLAATTKVGGALGLYDPFDGALTARAGLTRSIIYLSMQLKVSTRLTGGIEVVPDGTTAGVQRRLQGVHNGPVEPG